MGGQGEHAHKLRVAMRCQRLPCMYPPQVVIPPIRCPSLLPVMRRVSKVDRRVSHRRRRRRDRLVAAVCGEFVRASPQPKHRAFWVKRTDTMGTSIPRAEPIVAGRYQVLKEKKPGLYTQ